MKNAHVAIVAALMLSGCVSLLDSPVASERLKGVQGWDIMNDRGRHARLVSMAGNDPDPSVRKAALLRAVDNQYGMSIGEHDEIAILNKESDASVRKVIWDHLLYGNFRHTHAYDSKAAMIRGRNLPKWVFGTSSRFSEERKKEYLQLAWSGNEAELLKEFMNDYNTKEKYFLNALTYIDNMEELEKCLDGYRGSDYNYGLKKAVARKIYKLDPNKYVAYVLQHGNEAERAMSIIKDESALTEIIMQHGDPYKENWMMVGVKKISNQQMLSRLVLSGKLSSIPKKVAMDKITDEGEILKVILDGNALLDIGNYRCNNLKEYVPTKGEEIYFAKLKTQDSYKRLVEAKGRLCIASIEKVTDSDFVADFLANRAGEDLFKMVKSKLSPAQLARYNALVKANADKEWHRKFDSVVARANAGDIRAMKELGDDAADRHDYKTALSWFLKKVAADPSDAGLLHVIGNYYYNNWVGKPDNQKALKYYTMALAKGHKQSQEMVDKLSFMLEHPTLQETELSQYTVRGWKPEKNYFFSYEGGEGFERLKVFQALPGGKAVLVKPAMDIDGHPVPDYASQKKGILYIKTNRQYVDGEFLSKGIYLYGAPRQAWLNS